MAEEFELSLDDTLNDGLTGSEAQDFTSNESDTDGIESYGDDSDSRTQTTGPVDEDDIKIGDKTAPIIMLFGPPTSGKSMTLVRLARYLRKQGYTVKADLTFKSDDGYRTRCDQFHSNLNTKEALQGNALNEFLLVKVIHHGKTICQILEAPGEHYFDPKNPEKTSAREFRPYLTEMIVSLPNRKIWAFITEAEWNVHAEVKSAYVERIRSCKNMLMKPTDKVVILYNKVDQKEELFEDGKIHLGWAEKAMRDEYEVLHKVFKNNNLITSLWRPYNYHFVPFITGHYTKVVGGGKKYTESEEKYPRNLWESIMKCIRG